MIRAYNFNEFLNEKSNRLNEDNFENPKKKAEILEKYKKDFTSIFTNLKMIFQNNWPELWDNVDFSEEEDKDNHVEIQEEILYTIARTMKESSLVEDSETGGMNFKSDILINEIQQVVEANQAKFDFNFTEKEIKYIVAEFIARTEQLFSNHLKLIMEDLKDSEMTDFAGFYNFIRATLEDMIDECIIIKRGDANFDSRKATKIYSELIEDVKGGVF